MNRDEFNQTAAIYHETNRGVDPDVLEDIGYRFPGEIEVGVGATAVTQEVANPPFHKPFRGNRRLTASEIANKDRHDVPEHERPPDIGNALENLREARALRSAGGEQLAIPLDPDV